MPLPTSPITTLFAHRELIYSLIRRDILARYRGSILGILWSFFNPLLMLGIYTFVFSVVFQARWGTAQASRTDFALILFAGLMVFNLFSETMNRAPGLILGNINYVKKVVFPLEVLPLFRWEPLCFNSASVFWCGLSSCCSSAGCRPQPSFCCRWS
jgi:lipopolysaccharide transport system permease protein